VCGQAGEIDGKQGIVGAGNGECARGGMEVQAGECAGRQGIVGVGNGECASEGMEMQAGDCACKKGIVGCRQWSVREGNEGADRVVCVHADKKVFISLNKLCVKSAQK
jgi:hypothetical protein